MRPFNQGNLAVDIQRKRKPATKTIQKKKVLVRYGISGKEKMAFLIAIILMVSVAIGVLTRFSLVSNYNYQFAGIQKQIKQLQDDNNQLKIQMDQLSSPERIQAVAKEMGLTGNEGTVKVYNKDIASN